MRLPGPVAALAGPEEGQQGAGFHRLGQGVRDHVPGRGPAELECTVGVHGLLDHGGDDAESLVWPTSEA
eukprot:9489633-Pyramimonas_sp.AAC.1